ncbi:MAG: hypothetical protein IJM64_05865 [Ottowia sp.]|nr:hypothetical protein [Ottowia sp.]MBQ9579108.1 hypothetical protein [Ottowia sp.]
MYTDEERNIVRAGMGAVRAVLFGADVEAARRLLYCLDWFMDPYYQNDFGDMMAPLKEALQELAVTTRVADVAEEALSLLEYTDPPYPILRARLGDVLPEQQPYARYLFAGGV